VCVSWQSPRHCPCLEKYNCLGGSNSDYTVASDRYLSAERKKHGSSQNIGILLFQQWSMPALRPKLVQYLRQHAHTIMHGSAPLSLYSLNPLPSVGEVCVSWQNPRHCPCLEKYNCLGGCNSDYTVGPLYRKQPKGKHTGGVTTSASFFSNNEINASSSTD
jgi:hypothetical protein